MTLKDNTISQGYLLCLHMVDPAAFLAASSVW